MGFAQDMSRMAAPFRGLAQALCNRAPRMRRRTHSAGDGFTQAV
jgi:hypothetical protein